MGGSQSKQTKRNETYDEKRSILDEGRACPAVQPPTLSTPSDRWVEWAFGKRLTHVDTSPSPALRSKSADHQFREIYEKEWEWRIKQRLEEEDGDAESRVSPHLPIVHADAQVSRMKHWQGVLHSLNKIDHSSLSTDEKLNFGVYSYQIKTFIDQIHYKEYEKPLNGDTAFWSNTASAARVPFASQDDYENYLKQLDDLPRYFSEQMDNMRAGLKRGFTAPKITLQGRDATILSVVNSPSFEENVYYTPFKEMPRNISAPIQVMLRVRAMATIQNKVLPPYRDLLDYFQKEYYPNAREELGADSLPDGKTFYQSKITEFTTTTLTPQQIHYLGLSEMKAIRQEMTEVIRESGFSGDFDAFLEFLRTDPQFYAKTPEELLKDAAWIAKEFDAASGKFFGRLPRERFAIIPVPLDIAPFYTSGRGGPGTYYVNTYDLPSRALYSLPALTLHESAPGHCFQMSLVKEHILPKFRGAYISAYGEGWGLYCERLGVEMGIYHTPYEKFGMLSYQAWRAARLVVDTGVHTLGWTREQAQEYVKNNTALSTHEVETEVDRYISWPAQALSYYLGMMEIRKSRAKAEKKLGDKFDVRAFHDALLQTGSVPLPLMVEHMERWAGEGGRSPYEGSE